MTANAQACARAVRGVLRVSSVRKVGIRHLSSSHWFWYAVTRGLSFVERCLGDVEVCDSEGCPSRQLEPAKLCFTLVVGIRTEGSSQGLSLERPLTSWKLFEPFPLAFVPCWLDMTQRCGALGSW